ncbi:MAG: hypothetical protein ACKV2U_29375 [Bryobacteraceae bacterium]
MPYQSPISRYLLLGIAVLMLGAAIPDAKLLLQQARQWRQHRSVQTIVIDTAPFR